MKTLKQIRLIKYYLKDGKKVMALERTTHYDMNGREMRDDRAYYDENGDYVDTSTTDYHYDEMNRLEIEVSEGDCVKHTYSTDGNGNELERKDYYDPEHGDCVVFTTRDHDGKVIREEYTYEDGDWSIVERIYNDKGQLVNEEKRNDEGETATCYEWYEDGSWSKTLFSGKDGEMRVTISQSTNREGSYERVTRLGDGTLLSRFRAKNIQNDKGEWFPVDEDYYEGEKLKRHSHYVYKDPGCADFVNTMEEDGKVTVIETTTSYWDK